MLSVYDRIGVISLHARARKHTLKQYPNSIFELGTLKGKALDPIIAENLKNKLSQDNIVFDYNYKMAGGTEIKIMHKMFNNPRYESDESSKNYNSNSNKLQIAQLEFDAWKRTEDWVRNGVDQRFYTCNVLGEILIQYLSRLVK